MNMNVNVIIYSLFYMYLDQEAIKNFYYCYLFENVSNFILYRV